jgi:phosphatidylglycerol---prolipoprotein diacylglyceryl transferase
MMPEMFRIFSLSVSGYMFFYILGIIIGAVLILRLSRKEELDTVEVAAFILLGIACGWIGSRLLVSLYEQIARLGKQPFSFRMLRKDFQTGGSFFGAVAASLLFAVLYSRAFFKNNYRCLWDVTAIGIALGHAVGRLGCFAAGCCFGIPTRLPWGVTFKSLGLGPHPFAGIPLHPVQLYEAALCFVNFILLFLIWKKRRFPGEVFCFYLINYGLIRFFLEFLRHHGAAEMAWNIGLSWYQIFSLLLIAAGCISRLRFKKTKNISSC